MICVTGGGGYLGSNLAIAIAREGGEILSVDLAYDQRVRERLESAGVRVVQADLNSPSSWLFEKYSIKTLIHFAGVAGLSECGSNFSKAIEQNLSMTVRLAEEASQASVEHFLYSSSVYAQSAASGFYGASKRAAEDFLFQLSGMTDLQISVLRVGSVFGGFGDTRSTIARLVTSIADSGVINMPGPRNCTRSFLCMQDFCSMICPILARRDGVFRAYKLAGQSLVSYEHLANCLSEIYNVQDIRYCGPNDAHHYCFTGSSYRGIDSVMAKPSSTTCFHDALLRVIVDFDRDEYEA